MSSFPMIQVRLRDLPLGAGLNRPMSEIKTAQKGRLLEMIAKVSPIRPEVPSWTENAARDLVDALLLTNPVPTYNDLDLVWRLEFK